MRPDRVSNPGLLTCKSGALPTVLRGPALLKVEQPLSHRYEKDIKALVKDLFLFYSEQ